jgi:hypothetical protein
VIWTDTRRGIRGALPRLLGQEGKALRRFPEVDKRGFRGILDELAGFAPG